MMIFPKRPLVGLLALALAGVGVPTLRVLHHAHAADDIVEGFFPALCEGALPPAELLALGDWPLDSEGIGCRPHPGVFDAVSSVAGPGGRPGAIPQVLAEYVLSLDPAPAAAASERDGGASAPDEPAGARAQEASVATFPVRDVGPVEAVAIAVLGLDGYRPRRAEPVSEPSTETPSAAPERAGSDLPLFAGQLVADDTLEEMRGGFETPGGLKLSFGIERVVYINGELSSTTALNVADLGALVGGAAAAASLPVGTNIALIQNGPNNTFDANALASGSFATVIQNSLDNQNIQTITTIDAQVNSAQMMQANRFSDSLRSAVNASLLR